MKEQKYIQCACGCDQILTLYDNRGRVRKYLHGHNKSRLGSKPSEETIEKIRNSNLGKKHSKLTREKMSSNNRGPNNLAWKGGQYKNYHGYILIWSPDHPLKNSDQYVYQHRLVMEEILKRFLLPNEVVHHINGIKDDNRIANLKLYSSNRQHMEQEHCRT